LYVTRWHRSLSSAAAIPALATAAMLPLCLAATGCRLRQADAASLNQTTQQHTAIAATGRTANGQWIGLDRNMYPGDTQMAALRKTFAFTGYWLNNPPGEGSNPWQGKRETLFAQGWGFLVLFNGRLDAEIVSAGKKGVSPQLLGQGDAAAAVKAARAEGFPANTTIFLDQEEGGRMLDEQSAYLLAWTEAVAAAGFTPGLYGSGQPVNDGPHKTITTIRDVREQIRSKHLHPVKVFAYNDACPPAPGCTLNAKPLSAAGEPDLQVWQYAQSPQRKDITRACTRTYARDGNCYAPGFPQTFLDMNVASSPDPSHGR
jgi:hypothetical protein